MFLADAFMITKEMLLKRPRHHQAISTDTVAGTPCSLLTGVPLGSAAHRGCSSVDGLVRICVSPRVARPATCMGISEVERRNLAIIVPSWGRPYSNMMRTGDISSMVSGPTKQGHTNSVYGNREAQPRLPSRKT